MIRIIRVRFGHHIWGQRDQRRGPEGQKARARRGGLTVDLPDSPSPSSSPCWSSWRGHFLYRMIRIRVEIILWRMVSVWVIRGYGADGNILLVGIDCNLDGSHSFLVPEQIFSFSFLIFSDSYYYCYYYYHLFLILFQLNTHDCNSSDQRGNASLIGGGSAEDAVRGANRAWISQSLAVSL